MATTANAPNAQPEASGDQDRAVAMLGAGVAFGADRVRSGKGRQRAVSRPDENAVTLAAEAATIALAGHHGAIGGVGFASTTPPYQEGGSVQALCELLGLQGDTYALEIAASSRDGLAAVRLVQGLSRDLGPVLLCAAHADPGDASRGDGAVALLLADAGSSVQTPLARLTPAAHSVAEIRDRWRLRGETTLREADRSFVEEIGTRRLASEVIASVPEALRAPAVVVGPDARGSASAERALGGPGDAITPRTGVLGTAHPLLRMLGSLGSETLIVSIANGLAEAVHVAPTAASGEVERAVLARTQRDGREVQEAMRPSGQPDFDPFASAPRSWRDRGRDLRLQGLLPASALPAGGAGRKHPLGTVIAWTGDRVYPGADVTEMVAVSIDGGGRFFGQVAMGEHVEIDDRVELVPRVLHHGGGAIQYFWKVIPCRSQAT